MCAKADADSGFPAGNGATSESGNWNPPVCPTDYASCVYFRCGDDLTEDVKIEDLQKQILELQKKLEESTTAADASRKKQEELEGDLKKSRDLNAELMNKVPGTSEQPNKDDDGFDSLSPEEQLEACIDHLMKEATEKWLAKRKEKSQ